jgi:imidazole glycerol-phosphate synthase subunit HisH
MIAIIDYGMGNVASVQKALTFLNFESVITNNEKLIKNASHLILPGVGSFQQGMVNLKKYNLIEILTEEVIAKNKPFLGICLGMQLIMENGYEPIPCKGLGWIKGDVNLINNTELPVPHLGWNRIYKIDNKVEKDEIKDNYYFIHSYHVVPKENVIEKWVDYEFPMASSIRKGNIYATQFHPEKSQKAGLQLLKNYFESNA